jgi:hypothetical protein
MIAGLNALYCSLTIYERAMCALWLQRPHMGKRVTESSESAFKRNNEGELEPGSP